MKWNVYLKDMNRQEIKIFNIFDHWTFNKEVKELKEQDLSFKEFAEELKHLVMYHFWSKYEYETVITSWPPYINNDEIKRLSNEEIKYRVNVNLEVGKKISAFDQLEMNWEAFVNYVWNERD